jgi:hypothetical protein
MKAEYDLSQMKSRKNPYASKLKESVTLHLGEDAGGLSDDFPDDINDDDLGVDVPRESLD